MERLSGIGVSPGVAVGPALVAIQRTQVLRFPVGPDGGDARSFAADPTDSRHLYLGTTNSWIYESRDDGGSWQRLAKLSQAPDGNSKSSMPSTPGPWVIGTRCGELQAGELTTPRARTMSMPPESESERLGPQRGRTLNSTLKSCARTEAQARLARRGRSASPYLHLTIQLKV